MNKYLTVLAGSGIGGSCYLLELYGVRILLDCGAHIGSSYTDTLSIPSPETIDAIFLSHSHLDHMGAIAYAAAVCTNAKIFMTEQTTAFTRYQLAATIADYIGADTEDLRFHNRILCQLVMNRVSVVNYKKGARFTALNGKECRFAFFPAGHVPGAAMTYLHVGDHTVLYTGDFSACSTALTYPYHIQGISPKTLVLCGTHATNSNYVNVANNVLDRVASNIQRAIARNSRIVIPVSQLTKGLEILALLQDRIANGQLPPCDLFVEEHLFDLARYYERSSETFRMPQGTKPLSLWVNNTRPPRPIIVFERSDCNMSNYPNHTRVNAEFTLHADYDDLVKLIEVTAPENVFVVHAAAGKEALKEERFSHNLKSLIYTKDNTKYTIE